MIRWFIFTMVAGLVLALTARPGEFNKKLNVGDAAPAWENLPGVDDKMHALADLKDKDVVIVVFTCNSCPVAVDYEDRIIALAHKHCGKDSKAALVAINVNVVEEDRLPKMKEKAKAKGFTFPYLFDETQKIARAYGATYTPEFFVLDKNRKVVYMGALDDRNKAENAKVNYLEPAVLAALKGEKLEKGETLGRGCLIRYLKEKK